MTQKSLVKALHAAAFLIFSANALAANSLSLGSLQSDGATAHTLSIVLPVNTGDDNRNSRVQVHYRRSGQTAFQ